MYMVYMVLGPHMCYVIMSSFEQRSEGVVFDDLSSDRFIWR